MPYPATRSKATVRRTLLLTLLLLLLAGSNHAAKLVLAGELSTELAVRSNELLAGLDHGLLRRDRTVRLNSNQNLRHIRVSDWRGEYVSIVVTVEVV